jgi:glyoxylate reductase
MARLEAATDLRWNRDESAPDPEELRSAVADREGLLCLLTDRIDEALFDAAPELRVVSNVAVGYENVDLEAATRRGVAVTNTPGVLTETTADLAFALILAVARRLIEGDALARSGEWRGWSPTQLLGADVHDATLGVVGLGRIGEAVARRARGFDMKVLYWNRTPRPEVEDRLGLEYRALQTLLEESDFVSVHLAHTPDTHHRIGRAEIEALGPDGYLVNTARGAVVDEVALIEALEDRRVAGAGLDVFEHEPEVPERLRRLDNVVLLPHLGSASLATRERMAELAIDNLLAVCRGERPPHLVNRDVWAS